MNPKNQSLRSWWSLLFPWFLITASGCISKPSLVKETFLIHPSHASASAPKSKSSVTVAQAGGLALRHFNVAPALEHRSFLYRIGDQTFERDPYAEFLVPPSRVLPDALRSMLRRTEVFKFVLDSSSNLTPDLSADLAVTEFHGDFRKLDSPSAVMCIRIVVLNMHDLKPGVPWYEKEIRRELPIPTRTAAALAEGWNKALGEIADEFARDMSRLAQKGAVGFESP